MRSASTLFAAAVLAVSLSGCFHASVVFDNEPSEIVEHTWVHSWVYGLVPPEEIDAEAICGSAGAHKVETQISVINGLVGALTFNIYTPMTVSVTCAR